MIAEVALQEDVDALILSSAHMELFRGSARSSWSAGWSTC